MPKQQRREKAEEDRYSKIGFMCGLEIHQRLATTSKLFCGCTSVLPKDPRPFASVHRTQRAVAGELGTVDKSAEFEEEKGKRFTYNAFERNTCLVDLDEEPPHEMNRDALRIALSMAAAFGMEMVDELQPMRKAVVDGSDPSAFQRTVMVAYDGKITANDVTVGMPSMFLEEESCGIGGSSATSTTYNTDRLGIPLIEIDTDPTIPNPAAAKDIALRIGMMLRLTGYAQRGIGSIRQDVNLSIKGGARVEIKGMQELYAIDSFIENEIRRQEELIGIMKRLSGKKAKVEKAKDVTGIFRDTSSALIKRNLADNGAAFAFALKGFAGELGHEINPNRRLGTEISDYAKMAGVHGIIHSDEDMKKYGISESEVSKLKGTLGLNDGDAFVIVAGRRDMAEKAARLAEWRAEYAAKGVPKETRFAHDIDGFTTRFMRPLPSGSRMYPETDAKPVPVTDSMRKTAVAEAPNLEKELKSLSSMIKSRDIVERMMMSPRLHAFKTVTSETNADPEFVANFMLQRMTELKRSGFDVDAISEEDLIRVFKMYSNEEITKQGVEELVRELPSGKSITVIVKELSLARIKGDKLKELVKAAMAKGGDGDINGIRNGIMSKYRLNVDGSELNRLLAEKE